jgi:hypothetical protein
MTLDEFVQAQEREADIDEAKLPAGTFYPRIWRGNTSRVYPNPRLWESGSEQGFTRSVERMECLLEDLAQLFRVVYPSHTNSGAYGARVRTVLLTACMEVEAQWRAVLEANGRYSNSGRYTTNDYVLLLKAMRLNQYTLKLRKYPDHLSLSPFSTWSADQPTQSLSWYDSYNKTKHNGDACLSEATLGSATVAVAAVVAMLLAQFGVKDVAATEAGNVFLVERVAEWHPTEMYYGPLPRIPWELVQHPF